MTLHRYPQRSVAIPTARDREIIEQNTPLAFLFCTSRSGTMLLQTMLDGHPELLHVPTFFKFFDFIASIPSYSTMSRRAIADAFVSYPAHAHLLNTERSHLFRGRLGHDMTATVVIDGIALAEALESLLPPEGATARQILFAIIMAFNWCLARPLTRARIALAHIHHGDWLWCENEVERYNLLPTPLVGNGIDILRPDKLIITVRNPVETIESLERLANAQGLAPEKAENQFDIYMRLYCQDWRRHDLIQSDGIAARIVRLEDMRASCRGVMRQLTEWLSIDSSFSGLTEATAYGLPWHSDIFSPPSTSPRPQAPLRELDLGNPDHALVFLAARQQLVSHGYLASATATSPQALRQARWSMRHGTPARQYWNLPSESSWHIQQQMRRQLLRAFARKRTALPPPTKT